MIASSTLALWLAVNTISLAAPTSPHIEWILNYDDARHSAAAEGKLIVLYFESSNGERSLKMDEETLNQPEVVQAFQKFICFRIDYEQMQRSLNVIRNDRNTKLANQYRVNFLPTLVITDIAGHTFVRIEDFIRPRELVEIAGRLPSDLSHVYPALLAREWEPDNALLGIAAADSFQQLHCYQTSNEIYGEIEGADTLRKDARLAEHVDMYRAMNYFELKDLAPSTKLFERMLDKYPKSSHRPEQLFMLVKLYIQSLNEIRAREYLENLRKEFPGDPYTVFAAELFRK